MSLWPCDREIQEVCFATSFLSRVLNRIKSTTTKMKVCIHLIQLVNIHCWVRQAASFAKYVCIHDGDLRFEIQCQQNSSKTQLRGIASASLPLRCAIKGAPKKETTFWTKVVETTLHENDAE